MGNNWHQSRRNFSEQRDTPFCDHKRNDTILEELKIEPVEEKLRRYKSNWLQRTIRMDKRIPNSVQL